MPDYYGGDQKNDGWVIEEAKFYQVFAPTRLKESLKKEIQDKFTDDLEGLIKIVYKEGKWNGCINEFIFIVNTLDNNLPHDSERFFDNKVKELQCKYSVKFNYKVTNNDYVNDLLYEINDIRVLQEISSILRVRQIIDPNIVTETIMIDLIGEISGNIHIDYMSNENKDAYNRTSSSNKIDINNLEEKREEIEGIIIKLDIVEKAINSINQDIISEDKFERVKASIINSYNELSEKFSGCELYDEIIEQTLRFVNKKSALIVPIKFLIVYIFDKCDIFKKE